MTDRHVDHRVIVMITKSSEGASRRLNPSHSPIGIAGWISRDSFVNDRAGAKRRLVVVKTAGVSQYVQKLPITIYRPSSRHSHVLC